MEREYYVYRHHRLDNRQPFYIGVGVTRHEKYFGQYPKIETVYNRAFSHKGRSGFWYNIVNKAGLRVEIIYICSSAEEARLKEQEFISLYGRLDLGTGILVNMTAGGDGRFDPSEEQRQAMAENARTKSWFRPGKDHKNAREVHQYDLDGNYIRSWDTIISATEAILGKKVKSGGGCILCSAQGKLHLAYGYRWSFKKELKLLPSSKINSLKRLNSTPVYQYNLDGKFLKEYESISQAALELGKENAQTIKGNISQALKGQKKAVAGFRWSFEKKEMLSEAYSELLKEGKSSLKQKTGKLIEVFNQDGNLIETLTMNETYKKYGTAAIYRKCTKVGTCVYNGLFFKFKQIS